MENGMTYLFDRLPIDSRRFEHSANFINHRTKQRTGHAMREPPMRGILERAMWASA
jgi:hypothetical protein